MRRRQIYDDIIWHHPHWKCVYASHTLHQLKRSVNECTDDDLRAVKRDLGVLREIELLLRRMLTILPRDMPEDFQRSSAELLPAIFFAGRILIWADLSLRNKGFTSVIYTITCRKPCESSRRSLTKSWSANCLRQARPSPKLWRRALR